MFLRSASPAFSRTTRGLLAVWAWSILGLASAQQAPASAPARPAELSVREWLARMHQASRARSYAGTFVVSSATGAMSSGRIWHACEGAQQVERVESLTGAPRTTFRRNDEVAIFMPESRVVRTEKRELLGMFPDLLKSSEATISDFYAARRVGADRVAGYEAEVVQLAPKDSLRFGYRIWSERKSGLVVKVQTLDGDAQVLEQATFSELQLDAPVRFDKLVRMMAPPEGWRVERSEAVRTTAAAEGWGLKAQVAGFKPVNCYKRAAEGVMQWVFSDGLAAVSLFVESYDPQRHQQEGVAASGATHTLTRRLQDWWVTAVGEVPPQTLRAFAQSLERRK